MCTVCEYLCVCVWALWMTEGFWQNEVTLFYQVILCGGGQDKEPCLYVCACVCMIALQCMGSPSKNAAYKQVFKKSFKQKTSLSKRKSFLTKALLCINAHVSFMLIILSRNVKSINIFMRWCGTLLAGESCLQRFPLLCYHLPSHNHQ